MASPDLDALVASLELVAARVADPAPLVYAWLFERFPGLQALFVRDRSGIVRGQMVQVAIEGLLDLAGDRAYAAGLLQTERVNHQGLGVPPEAFDSFYGVLLEVFREICGTEWTAEMEASWSRLTAAAVTAAVDA